MCKKQMCWHIKVSPFFPRPFPVCIHRELKNDIYLVECPTISKAKNPFAYYAFWATEFLGNIILLKREHKIGQLVKFLNMYLLHNYYIQVVSKL